VAGDEIVIIAGTYNESITISKSLTLTGVPGDQATTIIAGASSTAVTITSDDVTISWLTVTNPGGKTGIRAVDHSNITITDCIVNDIGSSSTTSATTHGIQIVCSSAAVDNIVITNNNISGIFGVDDHSIEGIVVGYTSGSFDVTNLLIKNNEISNIQASTDPWPAGHGAYGIQLNHSHSTGQTVAPIICNNTIYDLDGLWATGVGLEGDTPDAEVKGNWFNNLTHHKTTPDAQAVKLEDNPSGNTVEIKFNSFNNVELGVANYDAGTTANAEKNWWGTTNSATITGMIYGAGAVDYSPYLLTNRHRMAFLGNRLVDLQQNDGGWDWPLDDGDPNDASPINTIGPITMGLAKAYRATGDPDMLAALTNAGGLLLSKTNNFSPSDGYLAPELDDLFGGTTYTDHVVNNFYAPLAAGTYDRNGAGTLYTTADYVQSIRDTRATQGIPNLAAWDVAMGLVGAASSGVTGSNLDDWIDGVKAEIDELDGDLSYDVIGLAGAVYGLAFVGEDHDPVGGEHDAAGSLADLADILASYQIAESGGFTWDYLWVIPYDCNETQQNTAYAMLALIEMGGYDSEVAAAADYLRNVQLCTGGWENYCGSGENNELTGEGSWAIWNSSSLTLLPDYDCYVDDDTVSVSLWMNNVPDDIVGGQFFLSYDDSVLTYQSADAELPFIELYEVSSTSGELDYAVQIPPQGTTTGTAKIATFTFEALVDICSMTDLITWRTYVVPTRLSDEQGQPVYPDLVAMDVIDNEAPVISCPPTFSVQCPGDVPPAYADMSEFIAAGGSASDNCSATLTLSCTDSGLQGGPCNYVVYRVYRVTDNCGNYAECMQIITVVDTIAPVATAGTIAPCYDTQAAAETAALTATSATDNCTAPANLGWLVSTVGDCSAMITVTVYDECFNTDMVIYNTTIDNTPPVITGCPTNITVNAEAGLCTADVSWTPPTATDNCGMASFTSTHSPGFTFPTGPTTVTYTAVDICGNTSTCTFTVTVNAVNEMVVTLSLDGTPVASLDRCITFELFDCGGGGGGTVVTDMITFTGGSATATVLVPCGVYTCVTARDALHTLARTVDFTTPVGIQYEAVFADDLLGGNLNDDAWIDILDFGIFSYKFGTDLEFTDCSTVAPHADINGDGLVNSDDFSYIQQNFLKTHDPACCSGPAPLGGSQPVTSVSVEDLIARGLSELAAGDLNGDGWLDEQDIVAFMQGARPNQIGVGGIVKPGLQHQK